MSEIYMIDELGNRIKTEMPPDRLDIVMQNIRELKETVNRLAAIVQKTQTITKEELPY